MYVYNVAKDYEQVDVEGSEERHPKHRVRAVSQEHEVTKMRHDAHSKLITTTTNPTAAAAAAAEKAKASGVGVIDKGKLAVAAGTAADALPCGYRGGRRRRCPQQAK